MIEFDVDMGYLLEAGELDCVILNDENGEYEPMKFTSELGSGTCTMRLLWCDYEDGECYECSSCDGMTYTHGWEPNYCENCGAKVVER